MHLSLIKLDLSRTSIDLIYHNNVRNNASMTEIIIEIAHTTQDIHGSPSL
jgi:hypothetical protein